MPVFFQFFPAQGGGIALRGRENGEGVAGDGAGDGIPVDPEMNVPDLAQYTSLTLDQGLLQGPKAEKSSSHRTDSRSAGDKMRKSRGDTGRIFSTSMPTGTSATAQATRPWL